MHPNVHSSVIYNSQVLETAYVHMDQKLSNIYTMEYYKAERKELLPFTTAWMEVESIMLSEISQLEKDNYYMISPISGT